MKTIKKTDYLYTNIYSDDFFLYVQKTGLSLRDVSAMINNLFQKYDTEQAVWVKLKEELDARVKRLMSRKLP